MSTHHTHEVSVRATAAIAFVLAIAFAIVWAAPKAHADTVPGSIAFVSERTGSAEIWTMDPDGANQQQVTRTLDGGWHDPVGAGVGTGKKIVAAKDNATVVGGSDLYLIDPATGIQTQLTFTRDLAEDDPTVLTGENGAQRIVYAAIDASGRSDLYVMQMNGSNQRQVTFTADLDEHDPAAAHSTGKKVASAADNAAGASDLYVVNIATGAQRQVTHTAQLNEDDPSVVETADGVIHAAYVTTNARGEADLRIWDSLTRTVERVSASGSTEASPALFPDGEELVYGSDRGDEAGIWRRPPGHYHGGPRYITDGYEPALIP